MTWSDLKLRLRALLFRQEVEGEMEDELDFHLQMQARKNRAAGMNDAAATRSARVAFGGAARVEEECRDARASRRWKPPCSIRRSAFRDSPPRPPFALPVWPPFPWDSAS